MIEESLFNALQDPSITAVATGGVWPMEPREDQPYPQVVYRFIASVSAPTLSTSGMFKTRVELNCLGASYSQAATLRNAVLAVLDGYISPPTDAVRIQNATVLNGEMDDFDKEAREYRCLCEVYLFHT